MFKKENRLNRNEFEAFFRSGKRFHHPDLTILYIPYPTLKTALVVGKKVSKKAVQRNLLKRRVYAVMCERMIESKATGVFIVMVKPSFGRLSRAMAHTILEQSIAQVLKGA
jgi:ribonuclease P protein component